MTPLIVRAVHPLKPNGETLLVVDELADAFARLKQMGERWGDPVNGWRLFVDGLRCPRCGETNLPQRKPLVEVDERGAIFCASCGTVSNEKPAA